MTDCPRNQKSKAPLGGAALDRQAKKQHTRVIQLLCDAGLLVDVLEGGEASRKGGSRDAFKILCVRAPDELLVEYARNLSQKLWEEHGNIRDLDWDHILPAAGGDANGGGGGGGGGSGGRESRDASLDSGHHLGRHNDSAWTNFGSSARFGRSSRGYTFFDDDYAGGAGASDRGHRRSATHTMAARAAARDAAKGFQPTPAERVQSVDRIIRVDVKLSEDDGRFPWIKTMFPAHDYHKDDELVRRWTRSTWDEIVWYVTFGRWGKQGDNEKVVDYLRHHYGEKVAYYFAFGQFYNRWPVEILQNTFSDQTRCIGTATARILIPAGCSAVPLTGCGGSRSRASSSRSCTGWFRTRCWARTARRAAPGTGASTCASCPCGRSSCA